MLIVCAHPDDEVLGAGVLIQNAIARKEHVKIVYATENSSRHGKKGRHIDDAKSAFAVMGGGAEVELVFWDFADQKLDQVGQAELSDMVKREITYQHDQILMHMRDDLNSDHRAMADATMVATRNLGFPCELLEMFVPSSSDVVGQAWPMPNVLYPATKDEIEIKCLALECYEAEVQEVGQRSRDAIYDYARIWGRAARVSYAEGFRFVRRCN